MELESEFVQVPRLHALNVDSEQVLRWILLKMLRIVYKACVIPDKRCDLTWSYGSRVWRMSALWQGRSVTADPETQANAVARGSAWYSWWTGWTMYFFGRLVTGLFYLTSRAKAQVCIGPTPFPKSVDGTKERVSTCWDRRKSPGFSYITTSFPNLIVGINIEKKQDPVGQTVFVFLHTWFNWCFFWNVSCNAKFSLPTKQPRGEAQALVESWKRFQSTEAAKSGKQWQTVYCDLYAG